MRRAELLLLVSLAGSACDDAPRRGRLVDEAAPPFGSAARDTAVHSAAAPRELVVASFNVYYENATEGPGGDAVEPETIAAVGKLADADVIAFQETNAPFERAIRKRLAASHPTCAFHAPVRYSPGGLGLCVGAGIRLVSEALVDSPVEWFPAQHVVLDVEGAALELVNVHLRPAIGAREAWWQANAATIPDREKEMQVYLDRARAAAIVVGDFNDPARGGVLRAMGDRGFVSALGELRVDEPTWRWAGEPPLEVQLDHVAIDRSRFEPVSGEVRHIGRSDHFPIVARIRARAR